MNSLKAVSALAIAMGLSLGGPLPAFADEAVGGFLYLDEDAWTSARGLADGMVRASGFGETDVVFPADLTGCTGIDWPMSPFLEPETGDVYWTYDWYEDASDPFYSGWSIDEEDSTARVFRLSDGNCETVVSLPRASDAVEFASYVDFDPTTQKAAFARRIEHSDNTGSEASSTVAIYDIATGSLFTYVLSWDVSPWQEYWYEIFDVQLSGDTIWVGGISERGSNDVYMAASYDLAGASNGSVIYPDLTRGFTNGASFYSSNRLVVAGDSLFINAGSAPECLFRVSILSDDIWPSPGVPYDLVADSEDTCWWDYTDPIDQSGIQVHPGDVEVSFDLGADGLLYFSTVKDKAFFTGGLGEQIVARKKVQIRRLEDTEAGEFDDTRIVFETSVDAVDSAVIGFSTFALASSSAGSSSSAVTRWKTKYVEVPVEIKVPVYLERAGAPDPDGLCLPPDGNDPQTPSASGTPQSSTVPEAVAEAVRASEKTPNQSQSGPLLMGVASGVTATLAGLGAVRLAQTIRIRNISRRGL